MTEIGIAEYFGIGEAVGIIATLFVIMYFSSKQMHELIKVVSKVDANSPEVAYAYDILFTFAHVFHMWKRKVLSDNGWTGWLRWMKSAFEQGTIKDLWKTNIDMEKWFDPDFQNFVEKELIPRV